VSRSTEASRILITGASGDAAQGVIKALKNSNRNYFIAPICINKMNPGFLMSDLSAIAPPCINEDEYINFLILFLKRNSIKILIPTIDDELQMISRRKDEIERSSGALVIVGTCESISICCDKLLTHYYLEKIRAPQPKAIIGGMEEIQSFIKSGRGIIVKPRFGNGSKGIKIWDNMNLKSLRYDPDKYIYQKFEKFHKEFTSVVMKDDQRIVSFGVLERKLSEGRTIWCKRVCAKPYEKILKLIARELNIPYVNIQFGIGKNGIFVFDLNSRFSGSTSIFSRIFNGPDLLVQKALTASMPKFITSRKYFESTRYFEDYIVERK